MKRADAAGEARQVRSAPVWLIEMAPVADVIVPNVVTAVLSDRPLAAEAFSVPPVVIVPVLEMPCGELIVTVPVPVVTGPSMPMPAPAWSNVIATCASCASAT